MRKEGTHRVRSGIGACRLRSGLRTLRKGWTLLRTAYLPQTLWLYFRCPHPRSAACRVYHRCRLRLHKTARVLWGPGAFLGLNARHAGHRLPAAQLWMGEGATLEVQGSFTLYAGGCIEILAGGYLSVGDRSFVNASYLCCARSIVLGRGCAIGSGVILRDTDHHRVYVQGEERPATRPIVIGDHVWICDRALIGKGVHIGSGAIVAAGAVVVADVPPRSLVGGCPARVLRREVEWSWAGHEMERHKMAMCGMDGHETDNNGIGKR